MASNQFSAGRENSRTASDRRQAERQARTQDAENLGKSEVTVDQVRNRDFSGGWNRP